MKKFLLFVFLISFCFSSYSQENPCPDIRGGSLINQTSSGTSCTAQAQFFASGDVNSNKSVKLEVLVNGAVAQTTCFVVPKSTLSSPYTGAFFTRTCGSAITLRITRYTASNGNCQGGTCGAIIEIDQSPLPVSLKAFNAARNKSNVALNWVTSTESNNKGFNVQRNTKGVWETIAFVFSAANGGNSSSDLSYSYNDANSEKGVSQYRIQQVDFDGKSKLSEIRSVRGEEMSSRMLVFPNPSQTGNVSLVFEDQSLKNIQVSDMSGRVVRQLKNVSNSTAIEGLENGVYSIQVTDLSSAAVSVEKVIIKKR